MARLSQTDYRAEPFVSCLMPQKKYEAIHMLEDENEAVRLAVRLAGNLNEAQAGAGFEAEELSPVVVARVCMESAVEDKGQKPSFTREEMALLAEGYFAIDGFFCDDPAVYDAGDTRGGVLHTFQPASVGQLPTPFTLRGCTIRNCVIGAKGLDTGGITLCGCTVENCQLGLQNSHAFNTLFTGNTIGCLGRCTVRFSDFVSNAHDVAYANNGDGGWVASGTP